MPPLQSEIYVSLNAPMVLDVVVHKTDARPLTPVFRKSSWTGLYLHFLSFVPLSFKHNLVNNLLTRAARICSAEFLDDKEATRTYIYIRLYMRRWNLLFYFASFTWGNNVLSFFRRHGSIWIYIVEDKKAYFRRISVRVTAVSFSKLKKYNK